MKPVLACHEWGRFEVGPEGLSDAEAGRFATLAEATAAELRLPRKAVLSRGHRALHAGQVCGVLHAGGRTLEILPKIDGGEARSREALMRMLAVAHDLQLAPAPDAPMARAQHDILEALIGVFARGLLTSLKSGPHQLYAAREADLSRLRGSLDVRRQFTTLAATPQRLACRYEELSPDTPLNRLLKAAARMLERISRADAHRRALRDALDRLDNVAQSPRPLDEPIRFDRLSSRFRSLAALARMMLSSRRQGADAGEEPGVALLFPMNDLFEAFVGRLLLRHCGPGRVRLQASGRHALRTHDGDPLFALKPDAIVDGPDGR